MNKRSRAAIIALAVPIAGWASPALAQEYPPTAPPPALPDALEEEVLSDALEEEVLPATESQAGPTDLPRTGSDTGTLVVLGGAVLAAGGALVLAGRRRRA